MNFSRKDGYGGLTTFTYVVLLMMCSHHFRPLLSVFAICCIWPGARHKCFPAGYARMTVIKTRQGAWIAAYNLLWKILHLGLVCGFAVSVSLLHVVAGLICSTDFSRGFPFLLLWMFSLVVSPAYFHLSYPTRSSKSSLYSIVVWI